MRGTTTWTNMKKSMVAMFRRQLYDIVATTFSETRHLPSPRRGKA
jgi:hypothetical protein